MALAATKLSSAAPYALIPTYFALATLPVILTHYVKQECIEPVNPVLVLFLLRGSFIIAVGLKQRQRSVKLHLALNSCA